MRQAHASGPCQPVRPLADPLSGPSPTCPCSFSSPAGAACAPAATPHTPNSPPLPLSIPCPTGKGAYGTVYAAIDTASGERVAIKVIPVTEQDREEFKQIQREVAFLADCNHPNVVRYLVRQAGGRKGGREGVGLGRREGGSARERKRCCSLPGQRGDACAPGWARASGV